MHPCMKEMGIYRRWHYFTRSYGNESEYNSKVNGCLDPAHMPLGAKGGEV